MRSPDRVRLDEVVARALTALVLLVASGFAGVGPAAAQSSFLDEFGPFVLERIDRDRWVHTGQHPGFVPFDSVRNSIHLDGWLSPASGGRRTLRMRLRNVGASHYGELTNRTVSITVDRPPFHLGAGELEPEDERARAHTRRRSLQGPGALQNLPAARFWEVPFVVPPEPLGPGVSWSDTLSFVADPGEGLWEMLEGVWHGEVLGDTVIGGRSLPLVRTVAEVRYRTRELHRDNAHEAPLEVERDVAGTLSGRAAVDTAIGVRAAGADTARLSGTAVLRTGDGRAFTSPVRYERERVWLLRDSTVWAEVQDSLRAEAARRRTGVMGLPPTPLEERLWEGEPALVDSMFQALADAEDPNERRAVGLMLRRADAVDAAGLTAEERIRQIRWEEGDTAGIIAEENVGIWSSRPMTERRLALLLPYLDDIGRLWEIGMLPDRVYGALAEWMLQATPILEPDPSRWGCEPAACERIIGLLDVAREPGLRDVALVGAFARDPAAWYEEILERAEAGSIPARRAAWLGAGAAHTSAMRRGRPVPEPGASWEHWLEWLGGQVRWHPVHRTALEFYAARTGRDPVQELRERWPLEGDSARFVVGTILREMNALPEPGAEELAELFLSGSALEVQAAQFGIGARVRREGEPLAETLLLELLPPLLDSIAARGDAPWSAAHEAVREAAGGRLIHPVSVNYHGVRGIPIFVLEEGIPEEVLDRLPQPFQRIDREAWEARPHRAGGALVTLRPAMQWEDFVSLDWHWRVFEARAPDEAPSGYAGSGGLTLLRTPEGGWRVVVIRAGIS